MASWMVFTGIACFILGVGFCMVVVDLSERASITPEAALVSCLGIVCLACIVVAAVA